MLISFGRSFFKYSINQSKYLSTSAINPLRKIQERNQGDTTIVEVVNIESQSKGPEIPSSEDVCSLCTCKLPIKISYKDVLILEQFMRDDGTVLPRHLTGLCKKQQLKIERCVMQAHWSGLFPDKTIPEFDRSGYKRFNRYWDDDMDMYRLSEKKEMGTWYYIKRYNSKKK
uniref:28S ribosomal protein S18a, mitochondrial n=1 Tax=Strongyloides papillosus TaxID=174720 RepID=A0A0N5BVP5_STREA